MVNALRRNIKRNISVALLLILAVLLSLTACVDKSTEAGLITVTINNSLSDDQKTIAYDGSLTDWAVDINAYRVLISDEAGTTIADSGVQSGTEFVFSGITPGTYDFTVQGIIEGAGKDYVIAESTESHTVTANARIAVTLKDVASGTAGDITLKVYAPLDGEYNPSGVRFTITGEGWRKTFVLPGDSEAKYMGAGTDEKGAYWTYLIRSIAGIRAGFCTIGLEIQASDGGDALKCTTGGIVYPGLTANGVVDSQKGLGQVATPVISEEINTENFEIGDSIMVDGIECLVGYDARSEQDWGRYVLIDKKHDLSYYTRGSDFYNDLYITDDLNTCEWGQITSGDYYDINSDSGVYPIIEGKQNTQVILQLIESNGLPEGDYLTIWDDLLAFYETHSTEWFIPSFEEFSWILGNVSSVNWDLFENLSDDGDTYYATSSEIDEYTACVIDLIGIYDSRDKSDPFNRVRLCRYLSENENMIVISEDMDDIVIYYTLDGSIPDQTSNLYSNPFVADEGTTIKARAFKDGKIPSEVVSYVVK